jgi:hypothetical protein
MSILPGSDCPYGPAVRRYPISVVGTHPYRHILSIPDSQRSSALRRQQLDRGRSTSRGHRRGGRTRTGGFRMLQRSSSEDTPTNHPKWFRMIS